MYQRDTTHSIVAIQVKHFLNGIMVEIYSKSLVNAISIKSIAHEL